MVTAAAKATATAIGRECERSGWEEAHREHSIFEAPAMARKEIREIRANLCTSVSNCDEWRQPRREQRQRQEQRQLQEH